MSRQPYVEALALSGCRQQISALYVESGHDVGMSATWARVTWIAVLTLAVTGCSGGQPPGNPDPGNVLLHAMSASPILSHRAPGSTSVIKNLLPAQYRSTAFQGSGWDGPAVTLQFRSAAPVLTVYRFYADAAKADGWRTQSSGHLHVPDRWTKSLLGAPAILMVADLGLPGRQGLRYEVTLSAGPAPR